MLCRETLDVIIDPSILPMFFASAILVMIAPGADMVFVVANSVSGGKRAGIVAALGIASGALLHFVAAAVGISALILTSELAYDVVRMLGAGYLAWVGLQYLTSKSQIGMVASVERRPFWQIYRQGVFTNLLNPKAILFNLSFVPQFVSISYGAAWMQILVLGVLLIIIGIFINLLIVILSSRLSTLVGDKRALFGHYFEKIAGVVLVGLAVYLASSRRQV